MKSKRDFHHFHDLHISCFDTVISSFGILNLSFIHAAEDLTRENQYEHLIPTPESESVFLPLLKV